MEVLREVAAQESRRHQSGCQSRMMIDLLFVRCFLVLQFLDPPRKVVVVTPDTNNALLLRLTREVAFEVFLNTGNNLLAKGVKSV